MATLQKITTTLWFKSQAAEAVKFYTSVFKNAKVGRSTRYGKAGFEFHQQPEGTLMTVEFEIEGQKFLALNGGAKTQFNESVSFVVNCDTQEEIDYYWSKLTENGDPDAQACGWLKDQFGVSWQVAPSILSNLLADPEKAELIMAALVTMKKLNISELHQAYKGKISAIS
jgi:predicted 3-demethylubiquinone-9 3-methyltransferase (glyoxalase superfamily)